MGFTEDYMMKLNNCNVITVLIGSGEFLDYDTNEVYTIHNIKLPFTSNGKHISVYSQKAGFEDVLENREYFDGKILNFTCTKVEHW
ncbi:hypothetical protein [Paenibacillus naphthalenovorans]|uniref:Uncharacterized protein n=1 Tax=Paenibacillus naphthalenovorans TaxID=162209 RepID=A0A0U2W6Y4_9BACL|nr:hypothetical protein [Paenibacillus naphthalenovorans]ALS22206.1 hypothetical protein IJ22_18320 [Paenibacillus naphthalenovorans]